MAYYCYRHHRKRQQDHRQRVPGRHPFRPGAHCQNEGTGNGRTGIPLTLLRIRPWHRCAVVEIGIERPGVMWRSALLVRPDVALFLGVARTHIRSLPTLQVTAYEKARFFARLRRRGVAVLNGDDPYVAPLAGRLRQRVITFGMSENVNVRGGDPQSVWPERLEFTLQAQGETRRVRTRLVGVHWTPSVLGAIAVALACEVPLNEARRVLETVEPFPGRLQPARLPRSGAVILRDEYNGALETFDAPIDVLRNALAKRPILVITDCSDFPSSGRKRARYYVQAALLAADLLVFIGYRGVYGALRAVRDGMRRIASMPSAASRTPAGSSGKSCAKATWCCCGDERQITWSASISCSSAQCGARDTGADGVLCATSVRNWAFDRSRRTPRRRRWRPSPD